MEPAPRTFSIGHVKGRQVIDANGNNVGTVDDVVVDPASWKVSGFIVSLKRDVADRFQLPRKGFLENARIEIGSERVRTVGDNVILNIDASVIGDALREREPLPESVAHPGAPPTVREYDAPVAPPGGYEPPRF